jgi:hypothetical protein
MAGANFSKKKKKLENKTQNKSRLWEGGNWHQEGSGYVGG